MNTATIILTVIQLIVSLSVIAIVLFQSGKSAGLSGAIGGVADSFMAKNKAKSVDAKLAKMTKYIGLAFVVLTLVLNILA
jgi:preprotein translocase subunit SecG